MKHALRAKTGAAVALISLFALTACGGGGGAAESPLTPPPVAPPAQVVADAGNLQTSVAVSTYSSGSAEAEAFSTVNALRKAAGAGMVSQATQIDVAAAAHAKYITTNIYGLQDFHNEDASKVGFYARTVGDRLTKAGYSWSGHTEVVGGSGASRKASDCVKGLLNTVYHGAAILSSNVSVGVGMGLDAASDPVCVVDFATAADNNFGQVPAVGKLVGYPHDGQTAVDGTFYVASEVPRPSSTLFPNSTAGTPVIVSLRNADYVNFAKAGTLSPSVTSFTLKDAGGNIVPAAILANSKLVGSGVTLNADAHLADGFAVLVPKAPLTAGLTYTVDFSATLKPGAATLAKTWSFSTKGSSSNPGHSSSGGSGQTPGVGTFAYESHSQHTSNGAMGDKVVITVRNVGSGTINNASMVCSGVSYFGGISGQPLPPGGTLSTTCIAAASGAYTAAHVTVIGVNASNSGAMFGPY